MIDSLTVRVMDKTIIQSIKSGKPPADVQKQPQFQTFHCRRRNLGQDFHFCWSLAESSHPHATKAFKLRVHQKAADSAHSHADLRFLRLNYSRLHQPRHKALSTALNCTRALWKTDSHAVLAPNSTQTSGSALNHVNLGGPRFREMNSGKRPYRSRRLLTLRFTLLSVKPVAFGSKYGR